MLIRKKVGGSVGGVDEACQGARTMSCTRHSGIARRGIDSPVADSSSCGVGRGIDPTPRYTAYSSLREHSGMLHRSALAMLPFLAHDWVDCTWASIYIHLKRTRPWAERLPLGHNLEHSVSSLRTRFHSKRSGRHLSRLELQEATTLLRQRPSFPNDLTGVAFRIEPPAMPSITTETCDGCIQVPHAIPDTDQGNR